ncbi:unnamed protein product [Phytophthora lilii]|uniref:Unnamed protein product n=1 Tax=Phytophthora lilii TaxID=2077276 RepID=A0A9W6TE13_9STRA|nr:unnamed protein product [Phytophthora lilii]
MIILTPFPSLVLVAAIDAMPLEDPERGLTHSAMSWVRATLTCFIYTHCAIDQIRLYSPNLKLTPLAGLFISLPSAILTNALALVVAVFVCWPLPFATILMSGPWFGFMTFFLLRVRGAHMRANPEAVKDVIWFAKVCGAQIILISVYAVFNTVFTNIPAKYQPVFALMIPAFKVVQKNILSRILAGRDDTKPQVIILNVEIFNALFISSCMQNSQSIGTSVTLIAVDLLQAAISILDLYRMVSEIKSLMDKLEITSNELIWTAELVLDNYPDTANRRPTAIVRNSNAWVTSKPQRFARASLSPNQLLPTMNMEPGEYKIPVPISRTLSLKKISSIRPSSNGRDAELTSTRTASINKLTSKEHYRLLKKALQVLFLTEFMLLIEFTEVLIPVIYGSS